jgi:tyrosinase
MTCPTRRSVITSGSAAVAAALAAEGRWGLRSANAANMTRFDASSAQGKSMLKIYAGAVGKMMDLNNTQPGNPLSWLFQWYTHGVNQPWQQPISVSFKQPEINRIYTNASDPNRALAQTMWDTCTHYGQPEMFFLPWHRMYVFYFEQIIRSISGEALFTLPYWDYTNAARHALPPEFTMPNDPVFKPLFRAQRKAGVNNGQPIDAGRPPFLNLNDMKFPTYLSSGPDGFCSNLDRNLHGNVHVNVGAQPPSSDLGMTFVPTAANDPIFWLHHCNIDRIWASWNKAGGANPKDATFTGTPFTFADTNGKAVQHVVGGVLDTLQLNYVYDNYLPRPPGSQPFPPSTGLRVAAFALHANTSPASGPVPLGAKAVTVPLATHNLPELGGAQKATNFSVQLSNALETRQLYVVLNNVQVRQEPGVTYAVYLNVPTGAEPVPDDPGYVGMLNFFSLHGEHSDHDGGASIAFPATDILKALQQQGRDPTQPTVTLVPDGNYIAAAEPRIGSISLVSQPGTG